MKISLSFKIYGIMLSVAFLVICSGYSLLAESPDDIVIIANKTFNVSELSVVDVRRMFKKEITTWKGASVKPIHAPGGSLLRQSFVVRGLGMNEAAEQKYWQDMKVKKGTSPPFELSNTIRAVFSAPGAISYCFRKDFNPAVAKMLLVL